MSSKSADIIKLLKKGSQAREDVIKWILENEYDKEYKKCNKCDSVELSESFRGKKCHDCYLRYQKDLYKLNNPNVKPHVMPRRVK